MEFFAPDGCYRDMAFEPRFTGREASAKFHRFMLTFALDSLIEFENIDASHGQFSAKCLWVGTYDGPLRLRSGQVLDAAGKKFTVQGMAVCRYSDDGKLTSHEDFWDLATVLGQVGVSFA